MVHAGCMGRGDLTDAEWERLEPLLPVTGLRGGRWVGHRAVINGIFYRTRTSVPWRDLPERFGKWGTVHKRHLRWSADGTWDRLLARVQAEADAAGDIDWDVSVDSTVERAHQHAAGARHAPPPAAFKRGAVRRTNQDRKVLEGLAARLGEVAREARR